jgi:hypothetical protein
MRWLTWGERIALRLGRTDACLSQVFCRGDLVDVRPPDPRNALHRLVAALVLLALNGRTPPSLANDGSDQGAEEGWGVINHSQLATQWERNDHD